MTELKGLQFTQQLIACRCELQAFASNTGDFYFLTTSADLADPDCRSEDEERVLRLDSFNLGEHLELLVDCFVACRKDLQVPAKAKANVVTSSGISLRVEEEDETRCYLAYEVDLGDKANQTPHRFNVMSIPVKELASLGDCISILLDKLEMKQAGKVEENTDSFSSDLSSY